jgi:hypothetical protein
MADVVGGLADLADHLAQLLLHFLHGCQQALRRAIDFDPLGQVALGNLAYHLGGIDRLATQRADDAARHGGTQQDQRHHGHGAENQQYRALFPEQGIDVVNEKPVPIVQPQGSKRTTPLSLGNCSLLARAR